MTRKFLLSLLLCLLLVSCLAGTCSAQEEMYLISNQQLATLENNNKELTMLNNERLEQLTTLKEQVKTLQIELKNSKAALIEAQSYSSQMKQSIKKLEEQANRLQENKIVPMIGYGNKSGFVAGVRYKANKFYDVMVMGNSKSFVMGIGYSL